MDAYSIAYTVGVKSRFGIFFKKYKVVGHDNENIGDTVRLKLRLVDGSLLTIPEIPKKFVRVYPDYEPAQQNLNKLKARSTQPVIQQAPEVEDLRDAISEGQ